MSESQLNVETEMNRVSLNRKQRVNWDHKIESCWSPKKQWKYGSNENLICQSQSKIFYGSQFPWPRYWQSLQENEALRVLLGRHWKGGETLKDSTPGG